MLTALTVFDGKRVKKTNKKPKISQGDVINVFLANANIAANVTC